MQKLHDIRFIYVTTPTLKVATELAKELLGQRLIACANIIPGMTSLYFWEGSLEQSSETVLILKTTAAAVEPCMMALKQGHPSVTPCIATFQVDQITPDFASWVAGQVQSSI
jgi:periplasmic divalent cation tolerance protein